MLNHRDFLLTSFHFCRWQKPVKTLKKIWSVAIYDLGIFIFSVSHLLGAWVLLCACKVLGKDLYFSLAEIHRNECLCLEDFWVPWLVMPKQEVDFYLYRNVRSAFLLLIISQVGSLDLDSPVVIKWTGGLLLGKMITGLVSPIQVSAQVPSSQAFISHLASNVPTPTTIPWACIIISFTALITPWFYTIPSFVSLLFLSLPPEVECHGILILLLSVSAMANSMFLITAINVINK